jgi:hypothetical protein
VPKNLEKRKGERNFPGSQTNPFWVHVYRKFISPKKGIRIRLFFEALAFQTISGSQMKKREEKKGINSSLCVHYSPNLVSSLLFCFVLFCFFCVAYVERQRKPNSFHFLGCTCCWVFFFFLSFFFSFVLTLRSTFFLVF